MKINQIQNQAYLAVPKRNTVSNSVGNASSISSFNVNAANNVHSVISFSGLKDKGHVLHVLAELPPWMKVGGVATVGKDYMNMANWLDQLKTANPDIAAALGDGKSKVSLIIPYYNGVIGQDNTISVRTIAGQPVWVNDVNAKKYAYNQAGLEADAGAFTRLKEVVSTDMQWGATKSSPVKLFQIVDHPALEGKENVDVYMLFTEGTARMPKAYGGQAYCSEPQAAELAKRVTAADGFRAMAPDDKIKALTGAYTSGQPYHQFSKGVVEAIEKAGLNAETIICSDSQTMLVPEFIAHKYQAGDKFFEGAKTTGIFHNTGTVYCGECSARDLFLAEATPEQIESVRKSPEYILAKEIGREEDYFKRFVAGYIDDNGNVNPNMGMLRHVQNGFGRVDTVSQEYAKSMALNPDVTPVQSLWSELYTEGKVGGIINGFEDSSVSGLKKLGLGGYTTRIFANSDALGDGRSISLQPYISYSIDDMKLAINPPVVPLEIAKDTPFEEVKTQIVDLFKQGELGKAIFHLENGDGAEEIKVIDFRSQAELDKLAGRKILGVEIQDRTLLQVSDTEKALIKNATEPTLETVRIARRHNKASFLKRFTEEFRDKFGEKEVKLAETGLPGRNCSVMGHIDSKYIADINAGKDVPLFVSWGRGDFQKGHPITLEAFIKFAKSKEGSNALLVMGGELPKGANETRRILELMERVNADSSLKGRIAFIDGFAPGYAMSSAAEFASFSSRFEPCGLTPPEAEKYFCTPFVVNTQGLSQQIFDPRTAAEGDMTNGYKTVNEFYMPKKKVDSIIELFATKTRELDDAAKAQLKVDFPYSCDDMSLFEQFGEEYQKLLKAAKDKVYGTVPQAGLDEQAMDELKKMPEYPDLINRLKEGILRDELAASMKQGVIDAADPVKAEEIFRNHLNLDTSWMGNAKLNGVDRQLGREVSSAELYCRRHILPDAPASAPKPIFQFREDLVNAKLDLGDFHVPNGEIKAIPVATETKTVVTGIDSKTIEKLNDTLRLISDKVDNASAGIRTVGSKVDSVSDTIKSMPVSSSVKDIAAAAGSDAPSFGKGMLANLSNVITDKRVLAGLGALAAVGTVAALVTGKAKTKKDANAVSASQSVALPLNTTQAVVAPVIPQVQPQAAVQPAAPVSSANNKFIKHFTKMA